MGEKYNSQNPGCNLPTTPSRAAKCSRDLHFWQQRPTAPYKMRPLNACEAALDTGQYMILRDKLGMPQSSRNIFSLFAQSNKINADLAEKMNRIVDFCNIALHDYDVLLLPILINITDNH